MEDPKTKLLTRLKESANVLVTVSTNPSLDQLAGAIGLTLLLNKLGKHATAVFSGEVPSILEYLKPAETLEKTTDSLRDFIIALDKSKADKLRYKVEDKLVRIFITPYHSAISEEDLEFSQGDFNVDVVVALGVLDPKDLDQAITAHGRILHDATVSSVSNKDGGRVGSIHWVDPKASSLCEMLYTLCKELKADAIDAQMATALLTGIVSETERFANEQTTAQSMSISSQLVAAGANQQLVAAKLELPPPEPKKPETPAASPKLELAKPAQAPVVANNKTEGAILVDHEPAIQPAPKPFDQGANDIRIDDEGTLLTAADKLKAQEEAKKSEDKVKNVRHQMIEPPQRGGVMTANDASESSDAMVDPLAEPPDSPLLSHAPTPDEQKDEPMMPLPEPQPGASTSGLDPITDDETLDDIERSIDSPHQDTYADSPSPPNLDHARDAVSDAMKAAPSNQPLAPRFDLNANPGVEVNQVPATPDDILPPSPAVPDLSASGNGTGLSPQFAPPTPTMPAPSFPSFPPAPSDGSASSPNLNGGFPSNLVSPNTGLPTDNTAGPANNPSAPPPGPPPMMPPNFTPQ